VISNATGVVFLGAIAVRFACDQDSRWILHILTLPFGVCLHACCCHQLLDAMLLFSFGGSYYK